MCRFMWMHGIEDAVIEYYNDVRIHRGTRTSVTFRKVVPVPVVPMVDI